MAGMMAAGAAIGSVVPGVGTAIGAAVGAVADIFMDDSSSAQPAPPPPPSANSAAVAVYGSGLNADNWNVAFKGSTQTNDSRADKQLTATGPTATTAATGGTVMPPPSGGMGMDLSGLTGSMGGVPLWAWVAIGGLVIWKLKSRK